MSEPLHEIAALLHRESGMVIREPQLDALSSALERLAAGGDPQSFLGQLLDPVGGAGHLARLVDEVTVKETFFLRDAGQLGQIDWHSLRHRACRRGDSKVRVWSAGCASGEEAYTVALLACEAFGTLEPPVEVLGTDISRTALARAEAASYRSRATRELSDGLKRRYFREAAGELVAVDALRTLVTFRGHNLVRDAMPPLGEHPFDAILCRNVLIYFDSDTVESVIGRLERALRADGVLVLGAADALCRTGAQLRALQADTARPSQPGHPPTGRRLRRPLGRRTAAASPSLRESLDADAQFLRGLEAIEAGNPAAAVAALRAALYADPLFGLAAFQLGRCHEAIGNATAARRAYKQALVGLETGAGTYEPLLGPLDAAEIREAICSRLEALRSAAGAAALR